MMSGKSITCTNNHTTGLTIAAAEATSTSVEDVFMARQPIFDREQRVYGYELLFRSSHENAYTSEDGDAASLQIIGNLMHHFGLGSVVADKIAFVNLTRKLLLDQVYTVLPQAATVIELLESVSVDDQVIAACHDLKQQGYRLALDDFGEASSHEQLTDLADFIKIDFREAGPEQRRDMAARLANDHTLLIAEKVETHEEFSQALDSGFAYVQGYFFRQPEVLSGKSLSAGETVYLRFFQATQQSQVDVDLVESIIKQDVSLSYQLLRYINSAAVGVRHRITSVRQAINLLGIRPLRKWAAVVTVRHLSQSKPTELLRTCLTRGRFCELVTCGSELVESSDDTFLLGLLSCIDAVTSTPLPDILAELPLDADIADTLLQRSDGPLQKVYELMLASEQGAWSRVVDLAIDLRRTQPEIAVMYFQALNWAEQMLRP